MTVYLLHFSAPIGDATLPTGYAQHYVGWTPAGHLQDRLAEHRAGHGAAITRAAAAAGRTITLALSLPGSRLTERRIKRRSHFSQYCPLCSPNPRTWNYR